MFDMIPSYVTCLIHVWLVFIVYDMIHWYVTRNDTYIRDTMHFYAICLTRCFPFWISDIPDTTLPYVTWHIHTRQESFICGMMHMRHDSCGTWLMCSMTHVRHDSCLCDMTHWCSTWLTHVRHDSCINDMSHSYVTWLIHIWRDSFICETTHIYVTSYQKFWVVEKNKTRRFSILLVLNLENSVVHLFSLCCFKKTWWYKGVVCLISFYRVPDPLSIHGRLIICDMTH